MRVDDPTREQLYQLKVYSVADPKRADHRTPASSKDDTPQSQFKSKVYITLYMNERTIRQHFAQTIGQTTCMNELTDQLKVWNTRCGIHAV